MCARFLRRSRSRCRDLLRTIEEVARADGSAGWCTMIGATSGLISGYLEPSVAREIYGDTRCVTGGVFAPRGKARVQGETYVASGRWPFASGVGHCSWLMGGCFVTDESGAETSAPKARMLLFPATEVVVHDTWDVAGLRGTGSHDIEVKELTVPVARSVSLTTDRPFAAGALYRFPIFGLLALGISAVTLGIASRAVEELTALATEKTPTGSRRRLAERSVVQIEVARAWAEIESARAFIRSAVEVADQEAENGDLSVRTRARLRLAATHATGVAAHATDRMYDTGGGTSIYMSSPLQRCFRDVHVATQHVMVGGDSTLELCGRVLLGVDVDASQL